MSTTENRALRAVDLARKIKRIATTPAEVTTGDHARAQADLAHLGVQLADVILEQAFHGPRDASD